MSNHCIYETCQNCGNVYCMRCDRYCNCGIDKAISIIKEENEKNIWIKRLTDDSTVNPFHKIIKTNKMNFENLNNRVIEWAREKGILDAATPLTQIGKTIEEVDETKTALIAKANGLHRYLNTKGESKNTNFEIQDGYGDILVTILIGCKLSNLDPLICLEDALDIIEQRTGKMIDGTFVKD